MPRSITYTGRVTRPATGRSLADLLTWLVRRRARRLAEARLRRLDDYLLRDMGIGRADIALIVREGRPPLPPVRDGD